jgi:hypothetical protein
MISVSWITTYNLRIKHKQFLLVRKIHDGTWNHITMHKKQVDKSCEGVELLSQRTLHPMEANDPDLQITH